MKVIAEHSATAIHRPVKERYIRERQTEVSLYWNGSYGSMFHWVRTEPHVTPGDDSQPLTVHLLL
jgi:hypothetical protein